MGTPMAVGWPGPQPQKPGSLVEAYHSPLFASYHLDMDTSHESLTLRDPSRFLSLVSEWEAAEKTSGDSLFWGPCAFQLPQFRPGGQVPEVHWERLSSTEVSQNTTSKDSTADSHLSGALGAGPGLGPVSITASAKYDRAVAETSHTYQDSFGARITLGDIGLKELPELTPVARMLLEIEGPDAFRKVFGTHYVSALRIGADAGYCLCFDSLDRSESHSLSLVIQIRLFFWTAEAELPLAKLTEITSKQSFSLLAYDTLEDWQHNLRNVNADHDLVRQGREIQSRIVRQSERLAAAVKGCHPLLPMADGRKPPILGVVVSPWTTLKEWHMGVLKWKYERQK